MIDLFATEQPVAPTESGEPCRLVNACTPIDLYYEFVKPAPTMEVGGPRAWVKSAGGRLFSVPMSQLTTAGPRECDSFKHAEVHRVMTAVHVTHTMRTSSAPGGRKRRETTLERRERLDRWDRSIL